MVYIVCAGQSVAMCVGMLQVMHFICVVLWSVQYSHKVSGVLPK